MLYDDMLENDTLKVKVEKLYDSILMKCCHCQGWSSQSKLALNDVAQCDTLCPLMDERRAALQVLWGIKDEA